MPVLELLDDELDEDELLLEELELLELLELKLLEELELLELLEGELDDPPLGSSPHSNPSGP